MPHSLPAIIAHVTGRAYYNESNKHAAGWLRNLAAAGLICPGDVDDRDIREVCANDLKGYTQHHFFAGIGIWSVALRMAGWPDNRRVTTGSCPCQPFSGAGKGDGFDDERHLWPAWHWLIQQYRPDTIFGEQVAHKDAGPWIDLVSADMESLAYTFAPVVLPVAGFGAPNERHRFFWVADTERSERGAVSISRDDGRNGSNARRAQAFCDIRARGEIRGLADASGQRCAEGRTDHAAAWDGLPGCGGTDGDRLGHASSPRLPHAEPRGAEGPGWWSEGRTVEQSSGPSDPWRELEWIDCLDGKRRPTQPGLFPLAPRNPGDVGKLRAYGNAISPQVAAEVIMAYMDERAL